MADDSNRLEPVKQNFPGIKQGLDPKAGYIIFEHDLKFQGESIFNLSHSVYGYFNAQSYSWQQVVDMDLAMEYLVVRVPAGQEDKALGKILGYGFSQNIVFYIFKAKEV